MKSHRLGKKYFQNIFAKELTTRILSEEALQIAVNRREAKTKGEKIYPSEWKIAKNSKVR